MKVVVFDNSGTLIERYRAIKDLRTGIICDDVSSIDLVDMVPNRALVVLQTDPAQCLANAISDQTIYHFLKKNNVKFDISYSSGDVLREQVWETIKNDGYAQIMDVQDTITTVIEKKYNVQICSGSGLILNVDKQKIEFTITAGGKIFPEVPEVIKELKNRGIHIYVASGDRKKTLEQLADFIDIPCENSFGTADAWEKREIISGLQKKHRVMMVGNSANDILALKEADIGVLTLQQGEIVPSKVFEAADVVVHNIKEILDIEF
ncbi:MAG: HAD family hydrolase [Euryarchaeota archaeon]|jgi:soluble P-type ATPase|nr:HAD family hydrolase [Euryarchaeota archaeon]